MGWWPARKLRHSHSLFGRFVSEHRAVHKIADCENVGLRGAGKSRRSERSFRIFLNADRFKTEPVAVGLSADCHENGVARHLHLAAGPLHCQLNPFERSAFTTLLRQVKHHPLRGQALLKPFREREIERGANPVEKFNEHNFSAEPLVNRSQLHADDAAPTTRSFLGTAFSASAPVEESTFFSSKARKEARSAPIRWRAGSIFPQSSSPPPRPRSALQTPMPLNPIDFILFEKPLDSFQ